MRRDGRKASEIELYCLTIFKFLISPVRAEDHSKQFYRMKVRVQKESENNMRKISQIAAEKLYERLKNYRGRKKRKLTDKKREKEMAKSIEEAIEVFENARG